MTAGKGKPAPKMRCANWKAHPLKAKPDWLAWPFTNARVNGHKREKWPHNSKSLAKSVSLFAKHTTCASKHANSMHKAMQPVQCNCCKTP